MTNVDLRELAIDRSSSGQPAIKNRRHVLTRYALPLILMLGFLWLVAWASWDIIFPPKTVAVMSVVAKASQIQKANTPLFNAAGWIEPRPTPIRVAALSPGVVEKLLVVEDQLVEMGDPIAELVKDDAKLVFDRAIADLELREAELDEAKAAFTAAETRFKQPVHLEAALGEADAMLAKIETSLKNLPFEVRRANADYKAMKLDYDGKASAKGVVSGTEIDIARSKADATKATVDELKDRFSSLEKERNALVSRRDALKTQLELLADERKEKDEAQAKIKGAKARVTQAEVAVAEAKLKLNRMTISAPVEGRVFRLFAHPGARIGGGMTQMAEHDGSTVVTMYRPDMLQVRVDVRFEDIPKISLNQSVEIDNPALSDPMTGKVLFISSEADIQKNTLQVKVAIPDPPPVFRPEMLVDVTFLSQDIGEKKATKVTRIFIPNSLLRNEGSESIVWIADQSESVARKAVVESGFETEDGLVEIINGLNVSSRVIISETRGISDGDRIRISSEAAVIDE